MNDQRPFFVVITGLSGAGHSVGINTLEDLGFYCIDNLPTDMLDSALKFASLAENKSRSFAIGMDIRDKQFAKSFELIRKKIGNDRRLDVIFLTATPETIAERYNTTRRKHPLLDSSGELLTSIQRERVLLEEVESKADIVLDTSILSPHQLARWFSERYSKEGINRTLHVTIMSFGFKYGLPRAVDCVYDVRFLANPFFHPQLKTQTGLEAGVRDFIFADHNTKDFCAHLLTMNQFLIPRYYDEGKFYLRIGIGCTGGQHRSVAVSEWLAASLSQGNLGDQVHISVQHRDLHL